MDKRKVIILAIVLFLFIGLGTFVFAQNGSDENGNGQGNNTIEAPDNNGGDNGQDTPSGTDDDGETEEGGNTGNQNRPAGGNVADDDEELVVGDNENENQDGQNTDNTKAELLAQLQAIKEKIEKAEDLDDIDSARVDRTEELVSAVEDLNDEELNELLADINRVLNDTTKPVISPSDLNGSYSNDTVVITISDDTNTNYTLLLNGSEVENADLGNLTEEGTYTLTVTDEAFNEVTVTFTIDKTNPVLLVNGSKVENDDVIYVNKDAKMTVDEDNLESFTSNDIDISEALINNGYWTAQKDGEYNIEVTDKAGNTTTYKVVVDKTPIEVDHLYVLNNSHNDFTVSDDVRYKVIGNGQKLYFEYVLKEEFSSTPVLTIGGQEFEMDCKTASWNDSLYKCDANITITEDMELKNGEIIPFTITGVKDIAQNETIVTEKNVIVTEKYGQVIYDNAVPVYEALGILNVTHLRLNNDGANESLNVANVGDEVRVLVRFDEELTTLPTLVIGGTSVQMTLMKSSAEYTYSADITLTADMFDEDCLIDFQISGYADAAGNVGDVLDASHTKGYADYSKVTLDTTAPDIKLNGLDTVYVKLNDEYNDEDVTITDNSGLEITPTYVVYYSETGEDDTFTTVGNSLEDIDTSKEGQYNVWYTATDAAGNVSQVRRIIIVKSLEPFAMGIYGGNKVDDTFYAKDDTKVYFNLQFDELLAVSPKVDINGEFAFQYGKPVEKVNSEGETYYIYSYVYVINSDVSEGPLSFRIYDYEDQYGIVGNDITNEDFIGNGYQNGKIVVDRTAPDIKLNGLDTVYVKLNDEYNDEDVTITDNSGLEITPTYVVYYSETGEDDTFTTVGNSLEDIDTSKEGQYNVWYTATDAAGNVSQVRRIIIVKSLEPFAMGIYGGNKVDDTFYAKDDTKVYFNLQFDELLAVSPKVDINGEFAFQYGKPVEKVNSEGETYYIYSYVYVINSDVSEGPLSFRIYDYEDQYGIVGTDITNEDFIGNGYQNGKIVVDRTAPDFDNLVDNSEDFAVSLGVTDDAFAYVELINQDTGRVIKEERYWTSFSIEGTWTAQVFDKAGNASAVYTFTIKPLVATAVINGQNVNFSSYTELFNAIPDNTETDITINKSTNEDMVIPENKIINIDLNGNTLSGDRVITNNGTINEISNGTIESTNNGIINNGSIGSIDNVTIDVYRTGINNKGKIDQIVNSTIEANYYPIYLSGTASVNKLAGNTVTGHYMDGIYVADESTINEIVSGNYTTDGMSPDGQTAGFGLYISSKAKVELISGGTFKGSKAAVANYGTIESIVGGIFEEKYTGNAWDPSTTFLYDGYVNSVSGGKFFSYGDQNEIFDRRIDFELAEGYEFVQVSDNYYEVQLIQN